MEIESKAAHVPWELQELDAEHQKKLKESIMKISQVTPRLLDWLVDLAELGGYSERKYQE